MAKELEGKRALVTGSGRGIGSAVALALAEAGAEVTVHYVGNRSSAEEVCARIGRAGGRCTLEQADLSEEDGADRLLDAAGPVDILVVNASVQFRRPWGEIGRREYEIQMNCNFWSSLRLIQRAAPAMREKRWGRIVTIGSVQEAKPHPDMLVYSASKAAQTMLVRSLALQLAGEGITVNNVAPGVIHTDRNRDALADRDYARKLLASIPLGCFGEPADCAGIVRLLCCEEGRYITGQSIYVDGGKSL